jgi:hypothetical protein
LLSVKREKYRKYSLQIVVPVLRAVVSAYPFTQANIIYASVAGESD